MRAAMIMTATLMAVPVFAQDRADQLLGPAAPPRSPATVAVASGPEDNEVRVTRALNDEIAAQNILAENQERAEQAAYEETVIQATRARLAHEEAVRQSEAARRRWEADRTRWQGDVAACAAGDRARCSPVSPDPGR